MKFSLFYLLFVSLLNSVCAQQSTGGNEIVQYSIEGHSQIKRGEDFPIVIFFFVRPEWYIYAPTGNNAAQGMIETNIVFSLPNGISRSTKMKIPKPQYKNGHEVYAGDSITMSQIFKISKDMKPGEYSIKGKITTQSCNNDICLPPVTNEEIIKITVY
jgi:hypothetical protein